MARSVERRTRTGQAGILIIEATERLLQNAPLGDLSVDVICAEAGVSRATYYHYFSSKEGALAFLGNELWDGIFAKIQPFVEGSSDDQPEDTLRETFRAAWQIWLDHTPVFRALAENWHTDPDLTDLWVGIMHRFTAAIAGEIDRQRRAKLAPPGPDSRELAAALLWSTAHLLYVAGERVDDNLPDESGLFDTVLTIWLRSVYHDADMG